MSKTNNQAKRQMRAIGHKLKPVVTVAGKGLSETVIGEIDRALSDHELIKIKLAVGGKEERTQISEELCKQTKAEIIHSIGNMILVLRRTKAPDPRKSNLMRPV
ncbi:MAG: RNA-binding protein [Alcanivorax sp.]|jgi:RNA-binding protein